MTEAYPAFKLGDPDTTKKVLVKNLICACTGLPRQDLEWLFEFKNATPQSSLALLGTMQPTSKFGEVFQYSNLMASAAGYIGGHIVYPDRELGAAYDEAMQKKIFDPFERLPQRDDYEGIGIGLANVSKIIQKHRGKIWCQSAPNQGATFYFTLPQSHDRPESDSLHH